MGSNVCPYRYGIDLDNYVLAFKDIINNKIKRGYKDPKTIFHSDQGSIYTSTSFNDVCINNNIIRSMSRAGTPTDNPIIESKNKQKQSATTCLDSYTPASLCYIL